ncbi:kinetochore-associated Ndc80 complex subunit spc25 [Linderina pennispora]|nr:kinetochore-associated Ndc80 complex subunit spc25 [Linderina pennispora]
MNTPNFQGFCTPKRRPVTPGRRDNPLPVFNSPASVQIGRMLTTPHASSIRPLEYGTPNPVLEDMAATVSSAVATTSEEYEAPRVWFQRDKDRKQNDEFTRRVDEMVQELKRLVRERKAEYERQKVDAAEREARMQADMQALEKEESKILSALKTEISAENELSKAISGLQIKQRQAGDRVGELTKRKERLEAEIRRRQDAIDEKRSVLESQAARDKPELDFFSNTMGIRIISDHVDTLTAVFTQISMSDPQREFTITVDLSQREYKVTEYKPAIASVQTHVDWLNATRDFFGFLKRIRHQFADHYNQTL